MKNFFTSKIFLLILVFVLLFICLAFARAYFRDYEIRQEIKELESKELELKQKQIESIEMLNYVSSDDYVEDQARLELNMLDEGEKVVFLEKSVLEKKQEFNYLEDSSGQKDVANYLKWWYYIIKHDLK